MSGFDAVDLTQAVLAEAAASAIAPNEEFIAA